MELAVPTSQCFMPLPPPPPPHFEKMEHYFFERSLYREAACIFAYISSIIFNFATDSPASCFFPELVGHLATFLRAIARQSLKLVHTLSKVYGVLTHNIGWRAAVMLLS